MGGVACREGFRRSEKTGHSLPAGSVRGPPGMQAFARVPRERVTVDRRHHSIRMMGSLRDWLLQAILASLPNRF